MICEKCGKNEASVHYHENINGQKKEYNLCRDCAAKMQKAGELKSFGSDFASLSSFFDDSVFSNPFKSPAGLYASILGANPMTAQQRKEKKCAGCSMTLSELLHDGFAGCPECYETFADELEATLKKVHGNTRHLGHVPEKMKEKLEIEKKISELEKERAEAVKNENYERAAEIRDEIKKLKGEM